MKSLLSAILLLILTIPYSNAQNSDIDSLKHVLAVEKQDTSKVLLLIQISRAYLEYKPDSSLQFAQQGLRLSRQKAFLNGEILSLKAMGSAYGVTGNYPKGLEMQMKAEKSLQLPATSDLEVQLS